jgi:hypothetical protein
MDDQSPASKAAALLLGKGEQRPAVNDESDDAFLRHMGQLAADDPPVEGQWFHNQVVGMDGRKFVRCFFDRCTLFVETGAFSVLDCKFEACLFHFSTPALNVVKLLNLAHLQTAALTVEVWQKLPPSIRPTLKDDGTISFGPLG